MARPSWVNMPNITFCRRKAVCVPRCMLVQRPIGERYAKARQQVTEAAQSPPNSPSDFGHAALEEARSLGHHWAGEEHVLLALLESPPESLANQALSAVGITYDTALGGLAAHLETVGPPVGPTKDGWCASDPTWHVVVGRSHGLGLGFGQSTPRPEHGLLALLWQVGGTVDALIAAMGTSRAALFDALDHLGVSIPVPPPHKVVVNPLLAPSEREATATGDTFVCGSHVVLTLLGGEPDNLAQQALHACGLGHESYRARFLAATENSWPPPGEKAVPDLMRPNPATRQLLARAEGLAAAEGQVAPSSHHGLLAFLWEPHGKAIVEFEPHGTSASEVASSLREFGVSVPSLPFPQPDREPWGERIPVPLHRLMDVAGRLAEELRLGTWGINQHDGEGWVVAHASVDLRPAVERALAE